jgi:hypothetical protein
MYICISQDSDFGFLDPYKSGNLALARTLTKKETPFQVGVTWVPLPQITYEGLFERSLREENLELHCHGQLHMWPTPLSGQSPKFQILSMMVLYR